MHAGTSKAAEPYKVGKRTTDTMLDILNLNKTEAVSIDTISNQDFTEVMFHGADLTPLFPNMIPCVPLEEKEKVFASVDKYGLILIR